MRTSGQWKWGTILLGGILCGAWRFATAPPTQNAQAVVVGPAVLLRLQREGVAVWDLRTRGRRFPGAQRANYAALSGLLRQTPGVALLVDDAQLSGTAALAAAAAPYLIPASRLEAHVWRDVPQLTPQQLQARTDVDVWDVSELEEWQYGRVPGSRHLPFAHLLRGERQMLNRRRALVFT
jgi:hypothetical protein